MALFSVKLSKSLCKCVMLQWCSLVVNPCRLTQNAACLPSKNCLHASQAVSKGNAKWRVEHLSPGDNIRKSQGIFVYHPIKTNPAQNMVMLTDQSCFAQLWEEHLKNESRQLARITWNHDRLMEKLLLQYGVKRNTSKEAGLKNCIKQTVDIPEKEKALVKAKVTYRNDLSCSPVVMMSDTKKTTPRTKAKTARERPDAMQMENMFALLCDKLPKFFSEPVDFDIYHKNVAFVNGITGITTRGLPMYKGVIGMAKCTLLLCMMDLSVEVLKITKHSDDSTIKVRWRIKGESRLRSWVGRRTKGSSEERFRYLGGFSVFEIGSDGLVHCHRLHKVMPSSPRKESPLWVLNYLAVLGLLNRRGTGEALGMFECRSTDKGLESVSVDSNRAPVPC